MGDSSTVVSSTAFDLEMCADDVVDVSLEGDAESLRPRFATPHVWVCDRSGVTMSTSAFHSMNDASSTASRHAPHLVEELYHDDGPGASFDGRRRVERARDDGDSESDLQKSLFDVPPTDHCDEDGRTTALDSSGEGPFAVEGLFASISSTVLVQRLLVPALLICGRSGRGTRALLVTTVVAELLASHTTVAEMSTRNASTTFRFNVIQVRGSSAAKGVQLSEWALFDQDGIAIDMVSTTSIANPGGGDNTQAMAIDGDLATNWRSTSDSASLVVEFASPVELGSYDWATSSSDANAHDPVRFTLDAFVNRAWITLDSKYRSSAFAPSMDRGTWQGPFFVDSHSGRSVVSSRRTPATAIMTPTATMSPTPAPTTSMVPTPNCRMVNTFAAFQRAVTCNAMCIDVVADLEFTSAIPISGDLIVMSSANATLDGGKSTQLFNIDGSLTIVGMTLANVRTAVVAAIERIWPLFSPYDAPSISEL